MLKLTTSLSTLIAQADDQATTMVDRGNIPEISKHFNDGVRHELPWELLLVGLGLTMMLITVISLRRWWTRRQDDPSGTVLFSAIARKAGLGWSDRLMLWRIARANKLPSPIALLLARGALRHHVNTYTTQRPGRSHQRLSQRIKKIETTLFGQHASQRVDPKSLEQLA